MSHLAPSLSSLNCLGGQLYERHLEFANSLDERTRQPSEWLLSLGKIAKREREMLGFTRQEREEEEDKQREAK